MRGDDIQQHDLFSYGSLEERVPANHPLRPIRTMVDEALRQMSGRFDEIYPEEGRRSIPPERLLRALLLQMLYSVRSERMLMEQLEYNLLFRWFVGLSADEPVWHPTVFTKNRDRLLEGAVAEEFFSLIVGQARSRKLLSDEHFTVDGTLVEAWAGQKSFQRKRNDDDPLNPPPPDRGGNPTVNWHKEKRSNETHESLTDAMARLYKKTRGAEAKLGYLGHVVTENRSGLVVDVRLTQATGTAERDAALAMLANKGASKRITLGGDRGYDTRGFVAATREQNITPHVAQNDSNRRSAIDGRTTRHEGYGVSQRKRKRVEEVFGWMKTVALQRKTRFRGLDRVGWMFT
ncbi:MAG: IS5 family transposase [Acidobacteriota bacterium]|nr:IS5 family transposase [Acidobacteriota bacterium]